MTKIALLTPTRARPAQFCRMMDSVKATSQDAQVYVAGSEEYIANCSRHWFQWIMPDGMPTVHKWNFLAQHAMRDPDVKLFMLCADDVVFETKGWDEALLEHYAQLENKIHVYHLQDSRNPAGTPHPIVTREYIDAMGYFLPPIFLHWFVDTWTVGIGSSVDAFTHLDGYILRHEKPSDTGPGDETHNRIRRMGWHERDKYVNDTCQHILDFEKARLSQHFPLYVDPSKTPALAQVLAMAEHIKAINK